MKLLQSWFFQFYQTNLCILVIQPYTGLAYFFAEVLGISTKILIHYEKPFVKMVVRCGILQFQQCVKGLLPWLGFGIQCIQHFCHNLKYTFWLKIHRS